MPIVLLINTSFPNEKVTTFSKISPPFGLLTIASPLIENGFEVMLIDPQIDPQYLKHIDAAGFLDIWEGS